MKTTKVEEVEITENLSFFTDEIEEIKEKKEKIQNEIKKIQQHCQVREIQYTKGVVPIMSSLKEKIENNENLAQEYHDEMILPYVETLIMIDSGSNVNLISKKLANILECNTYKVKEELNVTSGRTPITEATTLSLILYKKMDDNHNQNILLLHNIPFKIVPNPDYMMSLGKQMERRYNIPLNQLIEVTDIGEISWSRNNNKLEELMEIKAAAETVRHNSNEGFE